MNTRNPVFDIMKGIGIILMLIGHIPPGDSLYHVIYSFHMPLFFIVAGVFTKTDRIEIDTLRKYALRLLLPVLVTMVIIIALSPLHYFTDHNFNDSIVQVLSLIWAGDAFQTKYGLVTIDSMWFLVALFWAKIYFQLIGSLVNNKVSRNQDEVILAICVMISASAVALHKIIPLVPWGLLKGLTAVSFLAIGWYLNRKRLPVIVYVTFILCWFLALRFGSIDMVHYHYGAYPLDIIGAVGATGLVFMISKAIYKYAHCFGKLLQWFGINSLLILCINTIDRKTYLVRAVKGVFDFHPTGLYNTSFHYLLEFLLVALFISIPFMKRIYKAKRIREIA